MEVSHLVVAGETGSFTVSTTKRLPYLKHGDSSPVPSTGPAGAPVW